MSIVVEIGERVEPLVFVVITVAGGATVVVATSVGELVLVAPVTVLIYTGPASPTDSITSGGIDVAAV